MFNLTKRERDGIPDGSVTQILRPMHPQPGRYIDFVKLSECGDYYIAGWNKNNTWTDVSGDRHIAPFKLGDVLRCKIPETQLVSEICYTNPLGLISYIEIEILTVSVKHIQKSSYEDIDKCGLRNRGGDHFCDCPYFDMSHFYKSSSGCQCLNRKTKKEYEIFWNKNNPEYLWDTNPWIFRANIKVNDYDIK